MLLLNYQKENMNVRLTTPEEIRIEKWSRAAIRSALVATIFLFGFMLGREATTEIRYFSPTPMQAAALKFVDAHPEQFRAWVIDPENKKLIASLGGWSTGATVAPGTPAMELCRLAAVCKK